jgi:hypothetical protein
MTVEPGIDRADWEAEWEALQEDLADSPAETLPELDDLIARMLEDHGYTLNDPVARSGEEREVVAEFLAAREITNRWQRGADLSAGDVGDAINAYRELYQELIAR